MAFAIVVVVFAVVVFAFVVVVAVVVLAVVVVAVVVVAVVVVTVVHFGLIVNRKRRLSFSSISDSKPNLNFIQLQHL